MQNSKNKKIRILALCCDDSAVGFYRLYQPMKILERLGLIELKMTPTFTWGKEKSETITFPNLEWFSTDKDDFKPDIIVAQRHDHINYISLIGGLSRGYGVPLVVDTDDDVQNVRVFNPGYSSYHPESENIVANIKLMSIPHVTALTVSTAHLREQLLRYMKPVFVVPNSIDFDTRVFEPKPRKERIRIGWLGSACHWENLDIIQQAVKDIVANYPVEFVYTNLYGNIWGSPPPEIADRVIPACKARGVCQERHSACNNAYVTFDQYAELINSFSLDIGLAPLKDNLFNRSKSNLRVLEYWADKIAVIASPVRPYSETIKDGYNGLLAKEKLDWYRAMEKLILDKKLLKMLKNNGHKALRARWNAEKNAIKLLGVYRRIIERYRAP